MNVNMWAVDVTGGEWRVDVTKISKVVLPVIGFSLRYTWGQVDLCIASRLVWATGHVTAATR